MNTGWSRRTSGGADAHSSTPRSWVARTSRAMTSFYEFDPLRRLDLERPRQEAVDPAADPGAVVGAGVARDRPVGLLGPIDALAPVLDQVDGVGRLELRVELQRDRRLVAPDQRAKGCEVAGRPDL